MTSQGNTPNENRSNTPIWYPKQTTRGCPSFICKKCWIGCGAHSVTRVCTWWSTRWNNGAVLGNQFCRLEAQAHRNETNPKSTLTTNWAKTGVPAKTVSKVLYCKIYRNIINVQRVVTFDTTFIRVDFFPWIWWLTSIKEVEPFSD